MKSSRAEFPASVKFARYEHAKGKCELCLKPIVTVAHYDHFPVAAALGGKGTFENCRCLCKRCHEQVTREHDVPAISKSKRILETRMGLRAPKRPFPKRANPWNRREA